ncbi:E3 ubiquitin-protein ligase Arkadia-like isoform X2 [Aphis craccivora]|uniref:E3 ubiquitin-protein ligase Arkadia-like isoform X2 n=1 Tax=Aphis craccivora TaxID=307492 RepID=A0A6G0Z7V2_APHCR|nr:E3 ubiquitin-protein ligase Arkadia-like isoform X2 [Aphis craccivora]
MVINEWSRHCRLPMFNPELQPEPVNLQNNNHHQRRPEPGRALEIAGRLQQERAAHNRPAAANPPAQDDREQTRHHA